MINFWANTLAALGVRPDTADDWADTFARVMADRPFSHDLDAPNFLGQVLHESGMLEHMQENLNYSAARLMQVWPRRFPSVAHAQPYARNPQALAERVYGGRMGNVNPGDGWKYRGRGLIQITGADNYRMMARLTGMPLLTNPDLLLEPDNALRASVLWWEARVPDSVLQDVERVTRVVNGGTNGMEHRRHLTRRAMQLLEDA